MESETWAVCLDYENYFISNLGRVQNRTTGRILKPHMSNTGYRSIQFFKNKQGDRKLLHRMVWQTFNRRLLPDEQINHKNGDKSDNALANLEPVTRSENMLHAYRVLKIPPNHGERSGSAKLKEADVLEIRSLARQGHKHSDIARLFNISQSTATRIINGRRWSHLN